MFHTDLRHRAVTTRTKTKVNHPGVGDTSELLANQGRELVSIATNLSIINGIARRGRDTRSMGHHSPNHQWDLHRCSLFFLTPAWANGTGFSPKVLYKHSLILK